MLLVVCVTGEIIGPYRKTLPYLAYSSARPASKCFSLKHMALHRTNCILVPLTADPCHLSCLHLLWPTL